jgi:hypothetical protein
MNDKRARESKTRPEAVARAVSHAMTARRPRTRYHVGPDSWGAAVAARLLPDRALDAVIRRQLASASVSGADRLDDSGSAAPARARQQPLR